MRLSHTSFKIKRSKVSVRGGRGRTVSAEPGDYTGCLFGMFISLVYIFIRQTAATTYCGSLLVGNGVHLFVGQQGASGSTLERIATPFPSFLKAFLANYLLLR